MKGQTSVSDQAFADVKTSTSVQTSSSVEAKKLAATFLANDKDAVQLKQQAALTNADEAESDAIVAAANREIIAPAAGQSTQPNNASSVANASQTSDTTDTETADEAASAIVTNQNLIASALTLATSMVAASFGNTSVPVAVSATPTASAAAASSAKSAGPSSAGKADQTGKQDQKAAANGSVIVNDAVANIVAPVPTEPIAQATPIAAAIPSSDQSGRRSNNAGAGVLTDVAAAHVTANVAEHSAAPLKSGNIDTTVEAASQPSTPINSSSASNSGETAFATQLANQAAAVATVPPSNAVVPGSSVNVQTSSTLAAKPVSEIAGAKKPDFVSSSDATSSASSSTTSSSAVDAAQSAQSNGSSTPHPQTDLSQAAAITSKTADNGLAQPQAVVMHAAAAHDTSSTSRTAEGAPDVSRQGDLRSEIASAATPSGEAAPATGVNAAKLIQTMSESEMHVGMRSAEFGDISIRTSISQQQMLAQISVDHSDLSQAILAHVSSVQTKLGNEYGLNASINVNHQGAAFSGDQGQSSQQQQQRGYTTSARTGNIAVATESDIATTPAPVATVLSGNRLDIRA